MLILFVRFNLIVKKETDAIGGEAWKERKELYTDLLYIY